MKICKQTAAFLLSLLLCCLLWPLPTAAAGSINLNQEVGLNISYCDGKTPIRGADFSIYLIATTDDCGELTTTKTFQQFYVNIRGKDDDSWRLLASTLEGYILRDRIQATDQGQTDRNGLVSFPTGKKSLTPGLYLVLGERHRQNDTYYDPNPFLVMLPTQNLETNEWDYLIDAKVKFESTEITDQNQTIKRTVQKVWDDKGYEQNRPKSITVQLLRNGVVYDSVQLSSKNNWKYTWRNLDNSYRWTVVEKESASYQVTSYREGSTFWIINSSNKTAPPAKPDGQLPQTGQLWWPVPLLICCGLFFLILGLLIRRGNSHEKE